MGLLSWLGLTTEPLRYPPCPPPPPLEPRPRPPACEWCRGEVWPGDSHECQGAKRWQRRIELAKSAIYSGDATTAAQAFEMAGVLVEAEIAEEDRQAIIRREFKNAELAERATEVLMSRTSPDEPELGKFRVAALAHNRALIAGSPRQRTQPNGVQFETLCEKCGEQSYEAWRTGFCKTHYPGRRVGEEG